MFLDTGEQKQKFAQIKFRRSWLQGLTRRHLAIASTALAQRRAVKKTMLPVQLQDQRIVAENDLIVQKTQSVLSRTGAQTTEVTCWRHWCKPSLSCSRRTRATRCVIATFHYTDPTGPDRTGPDQTKSAHFVWYWLNYTTRARPQRTGPARTRTTRISEKLRWSVRVSDKLRAGPCGSVRVRAGLVGPV